MVSMASSTVDARRCTTSSSSAPERRDVERVRARVAFAFAFAGDAAAADEDRGETTKTAGVDAPANTSTNTRAPTTTGSIPSPSRAALSRAVGVDAMPAPSNAPHRTLVARTPRSRDSTASSSNAAFALA